VLPVIQVVNERLDGYIIALLITLCNSIAYIFLQKNAGQRRAAVKK
jgi:hypothetical protein